MGWQNKQGKSTFVQGVTLLGLAAIISKCLGTLQKIPLQNIGGDEVFGIYSAVYPFYTLVLFLATAGIPVAVSKFVSEYTATGNHGEARRVVRIANVILSLTGIAFFLLLFFGAQWIAEWMDNKQTAPAIQSVSFALLLVPLMASLRGYFQGLQNMMPTAVSQVAEQFVRVITMIALLLYFVSLEFTEEWIAAGATFGSVMGAAAGMLVMLFYRQRARAKEGAFIHSASKQMHKEALGSLLRKLIMYALPVCLGAIVVPVLHIVDTFSLPRLLKLNGLSESGAMIQFGIYARGLPLVQLVTMLFSAMSVALVPSIAAASVRGEWDAIRHRAELSIRLTWLIGWAASVGLAVSAVPMNIMFYTDEQGSVTMAILAFTAVFSALNVITASILQGTGAVIVPAVSLLFAALVKLGLNMLWIPVWGIDGAAAAAVVTFMIASLINVLAIQRRIRLSVHWLDYIVRPLVALGAMALLLWLWFEGWRLVAGWLNWHENSRLLVTAISLPAVGLGALGYLLILLRTGVLRERELRLVPGPGYKLILWLQKWNR